MGTTRNVGAMTVQVSMLGIVVRDMPTDLRFYRLAGLDIPTEADEQPFVIHRMESGVSVFFDTVFGRTTPTTGCLRAPATQASSSSTWATTPEWTRATPSSSPPATTAGWRRRRPRGRTPRWSTTPTGT